MDLLAGHLVADATARPPAGTTVEVARTGDDDAVVVEVRDDGPGAPRRVQLSRAAA